MDVTSLDWQMIGALGEIIGALAVVITLIYLARQVRDNTRVSRSATRQSIAEMTMSVSEDLISDREMAVRFLKDLQGADLDPVDRLQLFARTYRGMRNYENIHYQYLSGMLTEGEWQGFRNNLKAIFEWPQTKAYWDNEQQYYSRSFQDEVRAILYELVDKEEHSHKYLVDEEKDSAESSSDA